VSEGRVEVFGGYRVFEQLGVGGMARVDRAERAASERAGRQVALKRMLPHVAANKEMIQAFVREAQLMMHLRHRNVAQTYEFGQVDDVHFIAMELVTGPTLREILQHCSQTTGPMPVPVALNILNQLCDALDYAHNLCDETGRPLGIIHRDVSPSNIILDRAGVAKLIDFGIAKVSTAGMQTVAGIVKGKFGYMAPEYLVGSIDARADLFAIGVIAHELLTNRPLFSVADDMETMRRMRGMPIEPPSRRNRDVPPEIDDVVMTALSRDPAGRWQHATALRTAMTTLTHRLGLAWTNQQAVEWIAWAFEQPRPTGARRTSAAPVALEPEPDEPSLSVHLEVLMQPEVATAPAAEPRAPAEPAGALPAPPDRPARRATDGELTLLGTAGPRPIARASSPGIRLPGLAPPSPGPPLPSPPLPGLAPPPPGSPLPSPPLPGPLQPLPYHPRRGTTGPDVAPAVAPTVAPAVAPADATSAPARRPLSAFALVLVAAGFAAAGVYLALYLA
jgi:serine/threonine protein kinase